VKYSPLLSKNIGPHLLVVSYGRILLNSVWKERYKVSNILIATWVAILQLLDCNFKCSVHIYLVLCDHVIMVGIHYSRSLLR